jgi:hypothetical protein
LRTTGQALVLHLLRHPAHQLIVIDLPEEAFRSRSITER